jgi:hypothetical protein
MSAMTVAIIAAIVGLLVGSALVPGAPVFGLPIVAVLIAALGFTELRRRQVEQRSMKGFRDRADSDPVEFTARDRETLAD